MSLQAVPALSVLCLRLLSQAPHQISNALAHLRLFPSCSFLPEGTTHITHLDPRLWASIIQIFDHLPPNFITYPIHLRHVDIPLLQQIQSTPYFSLVTLVELPGCPHIKDDVVSHFLHLHSLVALDISGTKISYLAIKRLAQSLCQSQGPWPLRILRLYDCRNTDNLIFPFISKFPLLCVLDLRGTQCIPRPGSLSQEWESSKNDRLFFPSNLSSAVDSLSQASPSTLWSYQSPFRLLINSFNQPTPQRYEDFTTEGRVDGVSPKSFYGKGKPAGHTNSESSYYTEKHQLKTFLSPGVSTPDPSKMTLYRDPPTWSALGEAVLNPVPDPGRKLKKTEEAVTIRRGAVQQAGLTKLREMAVHRKDISNSSTDLTLAKSCQPSKRDSKNPFAKRGRE